MDVTFSLRAARGESCITDATQRFSTLLCLVYKEPESISTAECSTELSKDLKKKKKFPLLSTYCRNDLKDSQSKGWELQSILWSG